MAVCMAVKQRKRFRGTLFWLVFCAASFAGGHYFHYWKTFMQSEYDVKVAAVLDGDTMEVEWFGGVSRLRIVGIDTFETKRGKKLRQQAEELGLTEDRAYELGKTAMALAEDELLNRTVTIRFPSGAIERDNFGRLLAYVYVDGGDYGLRLLAEGLAYPRPESHVREKYYQWPVVQARNDKKGIYAP